MAPRDNDIVNQQRLILASSSPRRAFLLKNLGIDFQIIPASIGEIQLENESPEDFAKRMACQKALSPSIPLSELKQGPVYSLGADTIVVLKNKVLGKPKNESEAHEFLTQLSEMTHNVITGFALAQLPDKIICKEAVFSKVTMKKMTAEEIDRYIQTGEPLDKAGAYGAQGIGQKYIQKIEGSVTNVIGLPMENVEPWLKKLGLTK